MSGIITCGRGKDLLFLHGYLASKESFYPQIEYFSRFYRVTAVDLPGFGENTPLERAYSVDDYADWTQNFLKEQNLIFPHVIAHSFGGRVAIKLLSRGEIFDRAVLTGCAGIVKRRTFSYKMKVALYRFVKKFAPRYAEKRFGSKEYRTLSPVMRESYKKIVNEDLREDAKRISRPVLFVTGKNDRETPISTAQIYCGAIKNSRLSIMENAGHFAFLDCPLAFNLIAEEFLSDS